MTFNFQWQDPKEMNAFKLLAEGEASFKVQEVIETTSKKSGEEMLKVVLQVTDSKGDTGLVDDYILASGPWKLKNLCYAVNKPEYYDQSSDGRLNPLKLVAEKGRCVIKTDKPDNPNFNERSIVSKYIDAVKEAKKTAEIEAINNNAPDDTIPF